MYTKIVVPAETAMKTLNEKGIDGLFLSHMERRAGDKVLLIFAGPRDFDRYPYCPPRLSREISKLQSAIKHHMENPDKLPISADTLKSWVTWIDEIMDPKPEDDNAPV